MNKAKSTPQWLKETIAKGLGGLVVLRLANTPPEEVIKDTAKIWTLVISRQPNYGGWDEVQDKWRIEEGFMRLYAECEYFPSPKMLIDRLPKRKQPEVYLIERKLTQAEKQRMAENCRKLRELLNGIPTTRKPKKSNG
ncbi:hypothetical protein [Rodentibacter abscessus]|uniref:hypothetical protein n=1 Tax=Rodentibacter abscessus TaxID=3381777 RepID=UPI00399CFB89